MAATRSPRFRASTAALPRSPGELSSSAPDANGRRPPTSRGLVRVRSRGRAAAAARWHWLRLTAGDSVDLATVERFEAPADDSPTLGRNQPLWCGSGRKYKHCYLGHPAELPPLPERVAWLRRKALACLERRGGAVESVEFQNALLRARRRLRRRGRDPASDRLRPLAAAAAIRWADHPHAGSGGAVGADRLALTGRRAVRRKAPWQQR
ncbi:SEC-C domain-containing protein [Blastococcus colisei]|uniref:SEC-C metal-binding domain-containing protein n=1 Tax=Blastococcus colisei TaxID=1564162 RepID=UPI001B87C4C5